MTATTCTSRRIRCVIFSYRRAICNALITATTTQPPTTNNHQFILVKKTFLCSSTSAQQRCTCVCVRPSWSAHGDRSRARTLPCMWHDVPQQHDGHAYVRVAQNKVLAFFSHTALCHTVKKWNAFYLTFFIPIIMHACVCSLSSAKKSVLLLSSHHI